MFGSNLTRFICTLCLLLFCQSKAKTFHSRNYPRHCTYVFAVDSELKWIFDSDDFETEKSFPVEVYSEYEESWLYYGDVELTAAPNHSLSAELHFNSMSTNPRFLYRKLRFHTRKGKFEVEFGRDLGEKCFPYKDPSAPFIERNISRYSD